MAIGHDKVRVDKRLKYSYTQRTKRLSGDSIRKGEGKTSISHHQSPNLLCFSPSLQSSTSDSRCLVPNPTGSKWGPYKTKTPHTSNRVTIRQLADHEQGVSIDQDSGRRAFKAETVSSRTLTRLRSLYSKEKEPCLAVKQRSKQARTYETFSSSSSPIFFRLNRSLFSIATCFLSSLAI